MTMKAQAHPVILIETISLLVFKLIPLHESTLIIIVVSSDVEGLNYKHQS